MANANEKIGGTPIMKYFILPIGLVSRGGAVRFFFLANGIEFKEELVTFEEWGAKLKKAVKESGENPAAHLPIIHLNGKALTEHTSVLRMFARQLGQYGQDIWQDFQADQLSDEYQTWRADWVAAFLGDEDVKIKYKEKRIDYYRMFNYMANTAGASGAHLVGAKPTYSDALLYAMFRDDTIVFGGELLAGYPVLAEFYKAFGEQPAVKNWCEAADAAAAAAARP